MMIRKSLLASVAIAALSAHAAQAQPSLVQPVEPGYQTSTNTFRPTAPALSALNVTTATVVKASPGVVGSVCVNSTTASSASSVLDSTTTSVTAATTILTIPQTTAQGTCFTLNWPAASGIVLVPGSGGVTLSLSYN